MSSFENLYSRLAAGTAKYRPTIREQINLDALVEWTTTAEITEMCGRDHDATLKALHKLHDEGLLFVRVIRDGRKQLQWKRRKPQEKIWVK